MNPEHTQPQIAAYYTLQSVIEPALGFSTPSRPESLDYSIQGDFAKYLLLPGESGLIEELEIGVKPEDLEAAIERIDEVLINRPDRLENPSERIQRKGNHVTLYPNASSLLLPIKIGFKDADKRDLKIEIPEN